MLQIIIWIIIQNSDFEAMKFYLFREVNKYRVQNSKLEKYLDDFEEVEVGKFFFDEIHLPNLTKCDVVFFWKSNVSLPT